ncbi:[Protein-PII] uridylyltransferase / [Protein-PII]-UMP uridylyl-removing enzyme [hydrothermal vent metagenome]|uniref:[Protein-PII] uridylyltransferase / [Protein-PII]-UMP uridylyl-removing enzyme n=1 Tax=hydrothermal vent metagenome TaxID=652676 RepID=A0A3B1B653_9ZZZZ
MPVKPIFDATFFDQEFKQSNNHIALFRKTLDQGSNLLREHFESGEPVTELVRERATLIDGLLICAWHKHLADNANASLIAVGGYGRGELHPGSDVDILILLGDEDHSHLTENLEQLLTFLWDIGLEIGHSVRTLAECIQEAKQDVTVTTNMMESRLLTGPPALLNIMRETTGPKQIWPSDQFFAAKWAEQKERHKKYGNTAYNLEPNIKEGPGGLRDIQMIGWVAKRHFGADNMLDLVTNGFLTQREYQALMDGEAYLWKVRFALHILNKRREDRLLFDYQRTLAQQFGFKDKEDNLAVEQFMQSYYRTIVKLSRLNEMLLQLFEEAILLKDQLDKPVHINARFQSRNGFLEVTHDEVFHRQPLALLEIFLLLQQNPVLKGVRANTIRLIRSYRHLINANYRNDIGARTLFMEIMRQPQGITHELRRMNRYGILSRYLPGFQNIVGRMQYDLFHVYTVDEHTLVVLRNLRRFDIAEHAHEFPLCSEIMYSLPKPELLYLAGLFHDIGKGRGGDHSIIGAKDTLEFCRQHDLSTFDCELVSWLVEKHLTLSMTAQRKDISDPEVIQAFAEEIGDPIRLDYLYLLTVADARATNPRRWNSWKNALLRELYQNTKRALDRGLHRPQGLNELIKEKREDALKQLQNNNVPTDRALALWDTMSEDYFQHTSAVAMAWQTQKVLEVAPEDLPLVLLRRQTSRGGTEVFHYAESRDGLFAQVTTVLDQLGLNIVEARIETASSGHTLNSYQVLEESGKPITGRGRKQEIIDALQHGLGKQNVEEQQVRRHIPRRLKNFNTPTRITFRQVPGHQLTTMKLVTSDRPGLLSQVGWAFTSCNIRLHTAKIATIGAVAEDIFFITDNNNQPVTSTEHFNCIEKTLLTNLGEDGNE